jgi:GAF domain-containing protein
LQTAMRRVAETGRAVLADCDSASITIIEGGRPVTVGSTNDTAQALDDAQYSAREGPCLAAAREGRMIRIDDIGTDERWPGFAASARVNGVRSSLSVPIEVSGPDTFAGFNVYGRAVGGFSEAEEELCEAFAGQASIVANAQAYFAAFELSRNMAKAMESRALSAAPSTPPNSTAISAVRRDRQRRPQRLGPRPQRSVPRPRRRPPARLPPPLTTRAAGADRP